MTPAARLAAAIEVLEDIAVRRRPAADDPRRRAGARGEMSLLDSLLRFGGSALAVINHFSLAN